MPIYEYECEKCHQVFEVSQSMTAPPLTSCERCSGGKVHRLLSRPAILFKGSGFHVTDYASSGKGRPANSESSKRVKKEETKSDTSTNAQAKSVKPKDIKPKEGGTSPPKANA